MGNRVIVIDDNKFWHAMRECGGIYARTVRYIKEHYEIEISRQAVRSRANNNPELYTDIREQALDDAEDSIQTLMRQNSDKRIKFEASKYMLDRLGKDRGFTPHVQQTITVFDDSKFSDEELAKIANAGGYTTVTEEG